MLAELGLDVSGDVSVIGFDDIHATACLLMLMTTMKAQRQEMRQRPPMFLVQQQIEAPEDVLTGRVGLDATLVIRDHIRLLLA